MSKKQRYEDRKKGNRTLYNLWVNRDFKDEFKKCCEDQGRDMSTTIRFLMKKYMEEVKGESEEHKIKY